jgi:Protein of unknown function (DUF3127).
MELSGKIVKVLQLQSGQGKNGIWKKQEYVLEYGDAYPKLVCFNLWGDKIDQFALSEGEAVTVSFDVESREYNGKYYTDVKAWKVDKGDSTTQAQIPSAGKSDFGIPAPDFLNSDDKDDLPF